MQFGNMPLQMMLLSKVVAAVRTAKLALSGVSPHMSQPTGICLKSPCAPRMSAGERTDIRVVDKSVFLQG